MGELRECDECGNRVVLHDGGGVHREIICADCNEEMGFQGKIPTQFVNDEDRGVTCQIREEDYENL